MTDESSNVPQQTETSETIDSIAAEFNLPAAEYNADRSGASRASSEPAYVPQYVDPLNENQWRAYQAADQQDKMALKTQVQSLNEKISSYEQQEMKRRVESDIQSAVSEVKQIFNGDPDLIEASLEMQARKDANFQKIWENRHAKPEALKRALKVLANQMATKYSVRQDPQLTENQRAARQSQQNLASNPRGGDEWGDMSFQERRAKWASLLS